MSIKFIHAADLHIDSPMKGLAEKDEKIAQKVREATRTAFKNLVDFAIDEKVAFIVVAGDVFDGKWDDASTGRWTGAQFARLHEHNVDVFIVYGNHDGKNKILKNMRTAVFPGEGENLFVFPSDKPEIIDREYDGERVAIIGQSYSDEVCSVDLTENFPEPRPNSFNIGVLHTGLDGAKTYAPTTATNLENFGYDYWALGHQHSREILKDSPQCWIAYSGVLQTRHVNESDNQDGRPGKGFFLVEIEDGRRVGTPEFYPCDVFRWGRVTIDLEELDESSPETLTDSFVNLFLKEIQTFVDTTDGRGAAVRVKFVGRSSLYSRLTGLKSDKNDAPLRDLLSQSLSSINAPVWIESFDASEVAPPIPDDFWEEGAFKEIRDLVLKENKKLKEPPKRPLKAGESPLPALSGLTSKLIKHRDALRGEDGDDGFDLLDPQKLEEWNLKALDVLADAFEREKDKLN